MKKLQILILCTVIWLAWVLLVNAKDLTNVKDSVSSNQSITDIYKQKNENNQTRIKEAWDENSVWKKTCDINLDTTTKDYTEQLIYNCLLEEKRGLEKCDINEDWEANIADITYFIDLCVLWAPVAEDLPTYESSSNNNKKDLLSGAKIAKTWYINKTLMDWFMLPTETQDEDSTWKTICENYADQYINSCLLNDKPDFDRCDVNKDWNADITDLTDLIDECIKWTNTVDNDVIYSINGNNWSGADNWSGAGDWSGADNWRNVTNSDFPKEPVSNELKEAFNFAHNYWMTSASSIEDAKMSNPITRAAMAKMLSNYAKNVLGLEEDPTIDCNFSDVTEELDAQYDNWITSACKLWLMWKNVNKFKPSENVSRWQFSTIISRMISWTKDWSWNTKYYEPHIKNLCNRRIITKCWKNPDEKITREQAMTMFMRAGNN